MKSGAPVSDCVRAATEADAEAVATVLRAAFQEFESLYTPEAFSATTPTAGEVRCRLEEGPVWVAVPDRRVLGTVSALPRGDELYLRSMAVSPAVRGQGIGQLLLDRVERFAIERGHRRIVLTTTPFLLGAIRLYERAGFVRAGAEMGELHGTPLFGMVKEVARSKDANLLPGGAAGVDRPGGILRAEMQQMVHEQRLGFAATVGPDGTPNLSPKGTLTVWDQDHLVFVDLRSPQTVANLRRNASVEINVVDPIARRGFRFKGIATIVEDGDLFERIQAFYFREQGLSQEAGYRLDRFVLVRVVRALPLISPIYDLGWSEARVRERWTSHHAALLRGAAPVRRLGVASARMEEVRRLVVRWYEEMWNRWDYAAVDELVAPAISFRGSLGKAISGREAFKEYMRSVQSAFPDFRNHVDELVVDDYKAAVRLTYSGTHRGELLGLKPTGRAVSYAGAAFLEVESGRFIRGWVLGDVAGLQEQLSPGGRRQGADPRVPRGGW
jgi:uncharacterized protein